MKKTSSLTLIAALALFAFSATTSQALEKLIFDIKLTGQTQGNGTPEKANLVKTKVATSDVLTLLADHYGTTFPSGAVLVLVDTNQFVVYSSDPNKGGSVVQIVDKDVLSYDESPGVYNQTIDGAKNTVKGTKYSIVTLHYNDGTTVLEVSGYATQTYNSDSDTAKYSRSIKANVSGTAVSAADGVTVVTGSVSAKGSGTSN
jgi:hypothetical protein